MKGGALIQLEDLKPGHLDAVFWSLCVTGIGLTLCIVMFSDVIASLYGEPRIADYLRWLWPTIIFIAICGVPVAILQRKLEFRVLAVRATLGVIAGGIVGVGMAITGYGPWSLVGQRLVQIFVNSFLTWFAVEWRPGFRMTRDDFRDIWGFSLKMLGLRATELISMQTPTFVIGSFLGPAALGQFTIAWRIVESISFVLVNPVRLVAKPAFAHEQRHGGRAAKLLTEFTEVTSLFGAASFLGLAAVAAPLILVFFGPDWEPTTPVLRILCLIGLFLTIERLQQAYCLALGHAGKLFALSFVEMIVGFALIIFAAQGGLTLVAAAFTARFYILWPIRFYVVRNVGGVDIKEYLKIVVVPILPDQRRQLRIDGVLMQVATSRIVNSSSVLALKVPSPSLSILSVTLEMSSRVGDFLLTSVCVYLAKNSETVLSIKSMLM